MCKYRVEEFKLQVPVILRRLLKYYVYFVPEKWNIARTLRNIRGKMEHYKHTITTRLCVENEHC